MPDNRETAKCEQCGRLFRAMPEESLCGRCRETGDGPQLAPQTEREVLLELMTRATGLSRETVEDAIKDGTIPDASEMASTGQKLCGKCHEKPALPRSDYCLQCRVEYHHALGGAAKDVHERINAQPESIEGSPMSTMASLEEKRSRTATSRINPGGAKRLKY